jgi:hypothetical protein
VWDDVVTSTLLINSMVSVRGHDGGIRVSRRAPPKALARRGVSSLEHARRFFGRTSSGALTPDAAHTGGMSERDNFLAWVKGDL